MSSEEPPQEREALTVVHKGAIEATDTVLARLRAEGLDAVALDDPNFLVRLFAFGTYRVRVAVPESEAQRAQEVMDAWDREASGHLDDWSRELGAQVRLALIPTVLSWGAVWMLVDGEARLAWFASVTPAVFLLAFVLIAIWKRRG